MVGIVLFFSILFFVGVCSICAGRKLIAIVIAASVFLFAFRYLSLQFNDFKYVMTLSAIAGLAGLGLAVKAKNTAFYIFGFICGLTLGQLLLPFFPSHYPSYFRWAVVGVSAVLGGFFVKDLSKYFVAAAAGFFGGYILISAAVMLVDTGMRLTEFANTGTLDTMYSLAYHLKDVIIPGFSKIILYGSCGCALLAALIQKPGKK